MTDPNQVAGFADYVFVGRVLDHGSTLEWQEGIYTDFRISVLSAPIKGQVPAEVVVRQLGGTLGADTWVLEDQPRLVPLNVTDLTGGVDRRRVTEYWTEAVRNQRWPDALR